MSTTHKATPYAREYDVNHGTDFHASDYQIRYALQIEVAEALGEALTGDHGPDAYLYDIVGEVVDSVMPVYYSDILDEWSEAGCPDPEDSDHDPNSGHVIFGLMTRALREAIQDFAGMLVHTEQDTVSEALDRLNTIYPYKTD
jgi:hypothetical protein